TLARRAIRMRICTTCYQRPAGSEVASPQEPRACEDHCTIFLNLHELMRISQRVRSDSAGPYGRQIRDFICRGCTVSSSAGDYCGAHVNRSCPLTRYIAEVFDVLEKLNHANASDGPCKTQITPNY